MSLMNLKKKENESNDVLAWVEPYTGNLEDYLLSKQLCIGEFTRSQDKIVLPTPNLLSTTSQVLKGLVDLWRSGHYHGGFSLAKTYYVMDTSGVIIKLCNFKKKDEGEFEKNLAEDCWAVKKELVKIRDFADALKLRYPKIDCCQLNGLINVLGDITPSNAESAFEEIKRQPYFWGKAERKEFLAGVLGLALKKPFFCAKVANAKDFISEQWATDERIDVLLSLMNEYRSKRNLETYDTGKRLDYVRFISGLYTHESVLKTNLNIDSIVQDTDPALCYNLYALLPRANTMGT